MTITLKTLAEASPQQVFDQVAKHLLTQKQKSLATDTHHVAVSNDVCFYRGKDGMMCAAGCLIGDDEYMPEMEGKMWSDLTATPDSRWNLVTPIHSFLVSRLQGIHDFYEAKEWPLHLRIVAKEYHLSCEVVDQYER